MKQPQFTLWPWKVLSISVPLVALAGAVAFNSKNHHASDIEIVAVFFSVVGAGNGYLMAMATGDLGRSVLAIPLGALSGYGVVYALSLWPLNLLYMSILALVVFSTLVTNADSARGGCAGCLLMLILGLGALLCIIGSNNEKIGALFSAYPLLCGCITGSMPLEWRPVSVAAAALAGTRAALYGVLAGLFGGIVAATIGSFIAMMLTPTRPNSISETVLNLIVVGLGLAAANFICLMNIFATTYRAERASESEQAQRTKAPPQPEVAKSTETEPRNRITEMPSIPLEPNMQQSEESQFSSEEGAGTEAEKSP